MTHLSDVTNGASLEDCHTNFFALADLSGIKWRRLCADSLLCYDPLDDPVLLSFSKCLAAGILCVWRRVVSQKSTLHHQNLNDSKQVCFGKELWIFWYGEEPDLTGLVGPDLAEAEQGSWESGLSYECRTLLFKALHNLIERCLLSRSFTRLGKWFVEPYQLPNENKSTQLAFSFNFFVHGESTVCASVDVRLSPAVYELNKCHMAAAQTRQAGVKDNCISVNESKIGSLSPANDWNLETADSRRSLYPCMRSVILSPYGMAGVLSGHGYKETDPTTVNLLSEWHQFYPHTCRKENLKNESDLPSAVEVIIGGVRMRYPSTYVFVTESDHIAACGAHISQLPVCLNPSNTVASLSQTSLKQPSASSILTPPTSPCEVLTHGDIFNNKPSTLRQNTLGTQQFHLLYETQHHPSTPGIIKLSVSQECFIPRNSLFHADGSEETAITWDFQDPSTITKCLCSRKKMLTGGTINKPLNVGATVSSESSGLNSISTSDANTGISHKIEKSDKAHHHVYISAPFHKRCPTTENISESSDALLPTRNSIASTDVTINGTAICNGSQLKTIGICASLGTGTPSSLPQLHTSLTQPSSVDSHPNTPSIDMSCSQTCSSDPIMPTLSPHPPVPKDDDSAKATDLPVGGYTTHSPSTDIGHTINIKEKPIAEELLSPFHTSLLTLLENTKAPENSSASTNQWPSTGFSEESKASAACNGATVSKGQSQSIERPVLPSSTHDDADNTELVMCGFLYDYSSISGSLWEGPPVKRKFRQPDQLKRRDSCIDELYQTSFNANGKDSISQSVDNSSYTPKDPYEFTDFDEAAPSEGSFRSRMDVLIKEEEKVINAALPSPPEVASPVVIPTSVCTQAQEGIKSVGNEQSKLPSPPTPRNMGSSFTREEDLQVTLHDLDNIFDTSSDSGDEMFQTPSTPTKISVDEFCGKSCKGTSGSTGILELTRMFPTPPSLEPNAAPSPSGPVGGPDINVLDNGDIMREHRDLFDNSCSSPSPEAKDPAVIYKPSLLQKFIGSVKYAPLTNLPSINQPIIMPPECSYKPSWFHPITGTGTGLVPYVGQSPPFERQLTLGQQCSYATVEEERIYSVSYAVDHSLDQRSTLMNYDLQSPASSVSSYLNKHLNSIDNASASAPVPEAHCLLVNLLLSDSMLNIFKDHNFDSCTLCVCNMNIKGSDAGVNLPSCLIPSGIDEPQYKCTCGFSAVVHRHRSYCSGLFYEDEVEATGFCCDNNSLSKYTLTTTESSQKANVTGFGKQPNPCLDHVPHSIVDLIKLNCKTLFSSFSLFHKANLYSGNDATPHINALEVYDGCEVCFLALEAGKNAIDNMITSKMDESLKPSCLHKWPYMSSPLPSTSQEIMLHLASLQPLLQEAVHKKNTQKLWDVTYVVSGPLTWRQFHRLAARGTEDQCEPQPIPSVTVGYDKDCLALSPFALKYWDKLLLEPYSLPRDVSYIVVAPENDHILSHVKTFFRELSSVYELYKMGRHSPVVRVLRDGIMRVGKTAAQKVADEPVDEWFNMIGDGPIANKLKLYARVCRHRLAPHLLTLPLDKSLLDNSPSVKSLGKPMGTANSPMPATPDNQDRASTPKPVDLETNQDSYSGSGGPSIMTSSQEGSDDDDQQPPALVIYIVEPFTFGSVDPTLYRLITLGLLRSYSLMLNDLPDQIRNSIHLQLVSLDSIMCLEKGEADSRRQEQFKSLAFSVFSQCQCLLSRQSTVKSFTGFGPAASQDLFLKNKSDRILSPLKIFNQPLILASLKDKQTELGEMFGDRREKSGILYCSYCLTEDRRWLLASCTNDKGEFIETTVINIAVPNRARRKKASVRKNGLRKLLDFILEILSSSIHPWRIIIGHVGRLGHGELRDWASLLSKKSLLCYSRQLRELCKQCSMLGSIDTPSILSACLVSIEPDSALRIMADQYTPDDRFSCNSCSLSTPEDATCTHILVFPTSATTQSSQATFHQEHIDPLPGGLGDDIFEALNDDDINVGQDINEIFRWTESPTQSPGNSPRRDSISQPGSPGASGRQSPFPHGGPNRSLGGMIVESQEEPLQLLQQPLALGYYVSTAKTGPLPKWFWSSCPQLSNMCPVFLKSALLIHLPSVQQNSDDILHANPHLHNYHPLDSNYTTDVLRYVLEGYNALSWLSLDPSSHDRRSCLPVHIQILMQLYRVVETLL